MKKYSFLLTFIFLLLSCEDKTDTDNTDLTLSKSSIQIEDEDAVLVKINDNAKDTDYTIHISDQSVTTAIIDAESKTLYIWGAESGESTITITNSDLQKASIKVKVPFLITRPMPTTSLIRMKKGDNYELKEFDPKEILAAYNENDAIVSIEERSNSVMLYGMEAGESDVMFFNSKLYSYNYQIQVVNKFELMILGSSSNNIRFPIGEERILLIDGNGGYQIEVADPSIVKGQVRPYSEEEKEKYTKVVPYGAFIELEGLNRGTTYIKVKDSENQHIEINITVL